MSEEFESKLTKPELANASDLYKDLIAGDPYALKRLEGMNLDMKAIKTAISYLSSRDNLSDQEKAGLISESWRLNYRVKPPTPEEFLTEKYLGPTAKTIYPYIKKAFVEFLDPTQPYRNMILYPFTGFGKSFLSTLVTIYISVCNSLMRDPWKYFGLSRATLLTQMLISYSLKKSRELLLKPFWNILDSSPFFERVARQDAMKDLREEFEHKGTVDKLYFTTADPDSDIVFDSGITIKTTSSVQGLLGLSIISAVLSELTYFIDAGKTPEYIMRMYNDTKARIYGRIKGDYYGRCILDSSPNNLLNPIDDYVVNHAHEDPKNYILKGAMWEWRPDEFREDFDTGNIFKIYTGGKGYSARILKENDPLLDDKAVDQTKIITVPGRLKQFFVDDLGKSLKDYAGIPTGVADTIITDYSIIEKMFDNSMKNIYTSISAPANESPNNLIWNQIKDTFFIRKGGEYEFYYLPHIQRCISIDQSEHTDLTSIAMAHLEREPNTGDNMFVVDFSIVIKPDANRINLAAIECFIKDLRQLGHINIAAISFDSFQSSTTIQNLKRDGYNVQKLSVDTSTAPYLNLISLLNRERIVCGKNIYLKNNLKCLQMTKNLRTGHMKIDHDASKEQVVEGSDDWDQGWLGYFGKDCSDSVCAAVEMCAKTFVIPQVNWAGGQAVADTMRIPEKDRAKEWLKNFMKTNGLSL